MRIFRNRQEVREAICQYGAMAVIICEKLDVCPRRFECTQRLPGPDVRCLMEEIGVYEDKKA